MNKNIIAVYGSLRKGLSNHRIIVKDTTEYLGEFDSEPIYSMYSLGGFPGLHENGNTSIKFEVYSVNDDTAQSVDWLEGYSPDRPATFYDKKEIETPFGMASIYIYVDDIPEEQLVESGDWKEYVRERESRRSYQMV